MKKQKLRHRMTALKWRLQTKVRRVGTAWRYVMGRTTDNDAWNLYHHAEAVTGFRCLEGFGEEGVRDIAIDRYGDRPELAEAITRACSRVADKWDASGDNASAAEDWALDLVDEYLGEIGIRMIEDEPARELFNAA